MYDDIDDNYENCDTHYENVQKEEVCGYETDDYVENYDYEENPFNEQIGYDMDDNENDGNCEQNDGNYENSHTTLQCLYDEVDMLSEYYEYENSNYEFDETFDGEKYCQGCNFLTSRAIASQWLEKSDRYSPKLLSVKHSADQCQMKDIITVGAHPYIGTMSLYTDIVPIYGHF